MIGEKQNHGNRAGTIHWSKSFTPFMINALFSTHSATLRATLRSHYTSFRSGRIKGIRFEARLAPHPNFAPFSRKTSYIPDVGTNKKKTMKNTLTIIFLLVNLISHSQNFTEEYLKKSTNLSDEIPSYIKDAIKNENLAKIELYKTILEKNNLVIDKLESFMIIDEKSQDPSGIIQMLIPL